MIKSSELLEHEWKVGTYFKVTDADTRVISVYRVTENVTKGMGMIPQFKISSQMDDWDTFITAQQLRMHVENIITEEEAFALILAA